MILSERVAALESRVAALEQAQRDLIQELRNERHELQERVVALEHFRYAHNHLEKQVMARESMTISRWQLWIALAALGLSGLAGLWQLANALVRLGGA